MEKVEGMELVPVLCDVCDRTLYFPATLPAHGIRVRLGLHEFSCRRVKFPLTEEVNAYKEGNKK